MKGQSGDSRHAGMVSTVNHRGGAESAVADTAAATISLVNWWDFTYALATFWPVFILPRTVLKIDDLCTRVQVGWRDGP